MTSPVLPPPHPTPGGKVLRPKSPGVERIQRDRGPSPQGPGSRRSASPGTCGSPRHSRPSSRGSSTVSKIHFYQGSSRYLYGLSVQGGQTSHSWRFANGRIGSEEEEREARRKFRVERKLQEMQHDQENVLDNTDVHHDIVEFAHNYFNNHERSPEGIQNYFIFFNTSRTT